MEVSFQLHTQAALSAGMSLCYALDGLWSREQFIAPAGKWTTTVKLIARRYNDLAIPVLSGSINVRVYLDYMSDYWIYKSYFATSG